MWTILKLIEWTSGFFAKHNIENPRLDAELLLSHILKKKRIDLYLSFEQIVSEKDLAIFKSYIERRIKREPLQYITGVQEFCGIPIKVAPAVLIPRPETEILVETVLKKTLKHAQTLILDLCTGSGAIIAALASCLPNAKFTGIDISKDALTVAKENTNTWKDRVELLCGDLFVPLQRSQISPPKYDIIVSNPPYCPETEFISLQPEVRDYEPKTALIAGQDGLSVISQIISNAHNFLKPNGLLAMEIGDKQAEKVRKLITSGKYTEPEVIKDYSGIERIVLSHGSRFSLSRLRTS